MKTVGNNIRVITRRIAKTTSILKEDLSLPVITGWSKKRTESQLNAKFANYALAFSKEIEDEAKNAAIEAKKQGYPMRQHEANVQYKVLYNKNDLLVIAITYYQYLGGAHGLTHQDIFNIDLRTGKILSLSDIFKSGTNYKEIIDQEIREQINAQPELYFPNAFKGILDYPTFAIGDNYLTIYFELYEIAPYYVGLPEFKIPFSVLGDTIKERFLIG